MRAQTVRTGAWGLLMGLGLVGLSCGSSGDEKSGSTLTIAWIPKEMGNEVFQTGLDGARLKATELSQISGKKVEILYLAPATATDLEGQKASVRQAIAAKVDAIAISCGGPSVSVAVDEATAAGIPVMTWDSDCIRPDGTPTQRFSYYGIDCFKTGQTVAQLMVNQLAAQYGVGTPVNVGILSGVPGASNLEERVAGIWNVLKDYPHITVFHDETDAAYVCNNQYAAKAGTTACATEYCDDHPDLCSVQVEKMVGKYPTLHGLVAVGLWPFLNYSPVEASNKLPLWAAAMRRPVNPLITVTYDTIKFQIGMAKEVPPLFNAMVGQKYWGWGYDVIQAVYDKLTINKTFPDFYDSGSDVVCPNNLSEMDAMWTSGNFTQPLSACSLLP